MNDFKWGALVLVAKKLMLNIQIGEEKSTKNNPVTLFIKVLTILQA